MKAKRGKSNTGPAAGDRNRVPKLKSESRAPNLEPRVSSRDVQPAPADLRSGILLRPYQQRWVSDPERFAFAIKSAQIGYSTATAAWAVDRCLRNPRHNIIFLSRSERQALELGEKAKAWVDGFQGVAADWSPNIPFGGTSALQHEIRFGNGSRIIVLAANPDTARGYTGDVVLDEFAFHKDSQAIFTAVYRQVSLGYAMRILSTPNGQQGKFYDLAKQLGLDSGARPESQPVRVASEVIANRGSSDRPVTRPINPWSGHWCDIFMAVEDGLDLNPEGVRAGCDDDTWLQEYCCQFVSQASEWISPELFQQCASSEATTDLFAAAAGRFGVADDGLVATDHGEGTAACLYAGWDIARNRDLSVIWINEMVGDVTWTRGVIEMKNTPTPDQIREARALMPRLSRLVIDKGGMGLVIFEALEREFPGQVEGVQFTQPRKEAMAVMAKRRMEEQKVRLPDTNGIRQSFRSVKKSVNALGQARFDAEHDTRFGHADHWWAFCLAESAALQPAAYHLAEVGRLFGTPVISGAKGWVL
jgi:phage FluMu gp28-like protein